MRFNLSRVDCKLKAFYPLLLVVSVLIYPEWIVNGSGKSLHAVFEARFNLSRVDCK